MKQIVSAFKKLNSSSGMMAVKIVLMLVTLYLYLLYADLSTAPEFIYNQF